VHCLGRNVGLSVTLHMARALRLKNRKSGGEPTFLTRS